MIPELSKRGSFRVCKKPSQASIMAFANSIKIHSGIVVGRLMREKNLDYTDPARCLITKFEWAWTHTPKPDSKTPSSTTFAKAVALSSWTIAMVGPRAVSKLTALLALLAFTHEHNPDYSQS